MKLNIYIYIYVNTHTHIYIYITLHHLMFLRVSTLKESLLRNKYQAILHKT